MAVYEKIIVAINVGLLGCNAMWSSEYVPISLQCYNLEQWFPNQVVLTKVLQIKIDAVFFYSDYCAPE